MKNVSRKLIPALSVAVLSFAFFSLSAQAGEISSSAEITDDSVKVSSPGIAAVNDAISKLSADEQLAFTKAFQPSVPPSGEPERWNPCRLHGGSDNISNNSVHCGDGGWFVWDGVHWN